MRKINFVDIKTGKVKTKMKKSGAHVSCRQYASSAPGTATLKFSLPKSVLVDIGWRVHDRIVFEIYKSTNNKWYVRLKPHMTLGNQIVANCNSTNLRYLSFVVPSEAIDKMSGSIEFRKFEGTLVAALPKTYPHTSKR